MEAVITTTSVANNGDGWNIFIISSLMQKVVEWFHTVDHRSAIVKCRQAPTLSLQLIANGELSITPETEHHKYSLLMHCIKIKSPVKFLLNEQYVFVGGNISFFVCYHVVPKRHSQLDYELNGL